MMRASKALQLFPLALLAAALLTVSMLSHSQDRYHFGAYWYMSGMAYYKCANSAVNWGNDQADSIRRDRAAEKLTAYSNMDKIDSFDNPPNPPAPNRRRLEAVAGWILYVVELTAYSINQYRNYNSERIISNIDAYYDGELEDLDDIMKDWTEDCAEAQVRLNNYASQPSPTVSWYVSFTGFNQWLGFPARRRD